MNEQPATVDMATDAVLVDELIRRGWIDAATDARAAGVEHMSISFPTNGIRHVLMAPVSTWDWDADTDGDPLAVGAS